MQTMHHTWKRSLAAFGLLAAFGTQNHAAIAGNSDEPASTPANQTAQSTAKFTVAPTPGGAAPLSYQWQFNGDSPVVVSNSQFAEAARLFAQFAAAHPGEAATADEFKSSANQALGAPADTEVPGSAKFPSDLKSSTKEKQAVETKLRQMTVDHIGYDGALLSQIVHDLGDMAAKLDPGHVGINFVLQKEREPTPSFAPGAVDPTTGLPVAAPASEPLDLNFVEVRLEPPLKHVRLIDVLDAITKVADHPIKYTVEDYGVVFSLDQSKMPGPSFSMPAPEALFVRTFKVDTNTFLAGLDATFGIRVAQFGGPAGPNNIQGALHELLATLGVNVDTQNKSIFYNQLTGILMVRGTQEDLSLVQAAIETLGGTLFSNAHGPPGLNAAAGIGARP